MAKNKDLREALAREITGPKIYRTFWREKPYDNGPDEEVKEMEFTLLTTAKQVHLGLGLIHPGEAPKGEALRWFCNILYDYFDRFEDEMDGPLHLEVDQGPSLMITLIKSVKDESMLLHVSPIID